MRNVHSIHFVGIKGVGMAPLAVIAKEAGFVVTGSDIAAGFITDSMLHRVGITPVVGFDQAHVKETDLVITTGAHGGFDNPEVVAAKEQHTPVLTQGQAVGEFMKGELFGRTQKGISIAGTHGKTTTTAMVATVLEFSGLQPSWVIGTSDIPSLGVSGHFGKGEYFVAEADEYANEPHYDKTPKMLLQNPSIAVVTNVEHDHPDMYPTLLDVEKAFEKFVSFLPEDGLAIVCGDDPIIRKIIEHAKAKVITYGFSSHNDYAISHTERVDGQQKVVFVSKTEKHAFTLQLTGKHNALNALAAYIVGEMVGLSPDTIKTGLQQFAGTKRRLEYIGELPTGALLYDDYAHHPTEIEKTLQSFREKFPNKKIVCLFQPHTYSRTKLLLEQFIDSLNLADTVVLAEIYPSAREERDLSVSSSQIAEGLKKQGKEAAFAQTLENVVQYIRQKRYGKDTVIITMGAGDIYTIANEILEHEGAPSLS